MPSSHTHTHTSPQIGHRPGSFARVVATCVVAATAVNLGLYAIGRLADAALMVDPAAGEPNHLVIASDVAWKTAVPLALGALMLALTARHSRRWTTITTVAGGAVAAISIPFVFTGAHDTITGVLLSSMHAITGLAYIMIATKARRSAEV